MADLENNEPTAEQKAKEGKEIARNTEGTDSSGKDSVAEREFDEIVKEAPELVRKEFYALHSSRVRQFADPIVEKVTPGHIDKLIEYSLKSDENHYKFITSNRWFYLSYLIIFLAFLIVFFIALQRASG
ncbi:MAG: hypothetical protein HQL06_07295 [Nitrospirae bacterium]|nr:hypothetical protein [Nitrospirota bacterium]